MILMDDAGGAYERIDHSPWNGCTLADFVMPFFLFIVGVAIAFALKVSKQMTTLLQVIVSAETDHRQVPLQRVPKIGDAVKKIVTRTLKMLFWGLLLRVNSFVMTVLLQFFIPVSIFVLQGKQSYFVTN
jgi:heparan-alpha-glucosaminide N-acetyltransferase